MALTRKEESRTSSDKIQELQLATMPEGDGTDISSKGIESMVLGVVSWWAGKHHRNQVLNLVTRHFQAGEVYEAGVLLAQACQLGTPIRHNNTPSRSACEANAIDLVNVLLELDNQKTKPKILIPSDQLGKVPLDALAISDERSVSARLESLEQCVRDVTSTMQRMLNTSSREPARSPVLPVPSAPPVETPVSFVEGPSLPRAPTPGPQAQSYAAAAATQSKQHLQVPSRQVRERSVSPSQKRKHGENEGDSDDGFRKPGRPRKTVKGASKVMVEGVGDYQPSLQYYVGNTPGKAGPEVIKKVLAKCSEPLLSDGPLQVEDIELLTQVENPRTKCWRIVVPYKYMSIMENPELYPDGWRYRKFFGSRKINEKNKQPRLDDNIVNTVMKEVEQERLEVLERQSQESKSGPGDSDNLA